MSVHARSTTVSPGVAERGSTTVPNGVAFTGADKTDRTLSAALVLAANSYSIPGTKPRTVYRVCESATAGRHAVEPTAR